MTASRASAYLAYHNYRRYFIFIGAVLRDSIRRHCRDVYSDELLPLLVTALLDGYRQDTEADDVKSVSAFTRATRATRPHVAAGFRWLIHEIYLARREACHD